MYFALCHLASMSVTERQAVKKDDDMIVVSMMMEHLRTASHGSRIQEVVDGALLANIKF